MAPRVPDEILLEILTPVLRVSDARFSDASASFVTNGESVSAILLVCKAWLRVSTPLLYNIVILRSTGQAQRLHAVLNGNPGLGKFIKKLRVEGGFGVSMHGILKSTPNITDLFISLSIRASDSVSGLVLGLPLINPRRLVLGDGQNKNKQMKVLMEKLESVAMEWNNLKSLVFPHPSGGRQVFFMNLARAPSVTEVSFPFDIQCGIFPSLSEAVRMPSIQTVEIRSENSLAMAKKVLSDPDIDISPYQSNLRFVGDWDDEGSPPPPPVNLAFTPFASSPSAVTDPIWARVLLFAMSPDPSPPQTVVRGAKVVDTLATLRRAHPGRQKERDMNRDRLNYLLVSKTFHRVGLPYLYQWPVLNCNNPQRLCFKFAANPSLGIHLRELHSQLDSVTITPAMSLFFTCTDHLTRLGLGHAIEMDWGVFCALAITAGSSLVELAVTVVPPKYTVGVEAPHAAVFCLFTALCKLTWDSQTLLIPSSPDASGGLPALEYLDLAARCISNVIPALVSMELPNIHHVIFQFDQHTPQTSAESHAFLRKHGNKIGQLEIYLPDFAHTLSLCPQLHTLDIHFGHPAVRYSSFYMPPDDDRRGDQTYSLAEYLQTFNHEGHNALQKITFRKLGRKAGAEEADWTTIFNTLETLPFTGFLALWELQIMQSIWPETNEHAIKKSTWVKRAERMLAYGIHLTDSEGVRWRPRLKYSTRK
ncbi:hypothetical protein FB45DRAFT_1082327 [Roridomyces roridus]|uniref:Uncharacterized protein n=1 Tax=Roridomyces roridus TaxID=1738132 RepID=A0AAD7FJD2_9AGAR|nr:hypothetical protein FB45DRAFT_1082327 [Roridomyces roridus]